MVKASNAPATQLTMRPSVATEPMARMVPKVRASSGVTWPRGMGRLAVRCISASMSASYHMLSAPEAPAPTAIQTRAMAPSAGWSCCGASSMPTSAVKTTSDITRGFIRATKSPMLPPAVCVGRRMLA
jgi:hypothetical protein